MTKRLIAAFFLFCLTAASGMVLVLSTGAQDDRAHQIGKKVKCMCGGCYDTAATCFHVGGAFSGPCDKAKAMLKQIEERVAQGDSDDLIVQSFVQQYGPMALIEPPHTGIGRLAWAMPALYLLAGGLLVIFVISRWRKRPAQVVAAIGGSSVSGVSPELLEHARRRVAQETED
jgi:cytochrome c-type biogenesis protein CcmH/NrfF